MLSDSSEIQCLVTAVKCNVSWQQWNTMFNDRCETQNLADAIQKPAEVTINKKDNSCINIVLNRNQSCMWAFQTNAMWHWREEA